MCLENFTLKEAEEKLKCGQFELSMNKGSTSPAWEKFSNIFEKTSKKSIITITIIKIINVLRR